MTRHFAFGSCLIDLAARELHAGGRLLQLSPRIFDCIAYLLEHHERAVGRDELIAAVWGKADIADTQLGQAILKARRAVGDSGDAQHTIRTIAGFGYRWVAHVRAVEVEPALQENCQDAQGDDVSAPMAPAQTIAPAHATAIVSDVATPLVPQPARRPRLRTILAGATVAALAVVVAIAVWRSFSDRGSTVRPSDTKAQDPATPAAASHEGAVAVLPADIDASPEWSWLRLGIMEFVAGRLRNAHLTVAPSENVVSLMRASPQALPDAVRHALDPRWLVMPNVRKTDAGWTVRLELHGGETNDRTFVARADDAITAARIAADQLLTVLGTPSSNSAASDARADELWSRIDAALLVDDLAGARRLLLEAPAPLHGTPEWSLRLAQTESAAGRHEVASLALDRLLEAMPAESDPALRARILGMRCAVRVRLGRAADAEKDASEALTLLEGHLDPALLGKIFMRRGVTRTLLGREDEALADFAQARIAMQLAGDTLGLAQIELNEGALAGSRNHPADALGSFRRAEQYFARFGVSAELAAAFANQVVAHRALLQPAAALAVSERSLALLGHLPSPESEHLIELRRAQALADSGRWSDADARFDELARAIDPAREIELAAMTANERAQLELARGQPGRALALAGPTVATLTQTDFSSTRAEAWFIAVRALHALDQDKEAADAVQGFVAWATGAGNTTFTLHARLAQAEQAVRERRYADADRLYGESLDAANRENVPADIADVAMSFGNALIARGELVRAVRVVGQLARFAEDSFGPALLQARLYRALGRTEAWRSALLHTRSLAGERPIPPDLVLPPEAANESD